MTYEEEKNHIRRAVDDVIGQSKNWPPYGRYDRAETAMTEALAKNGPGGIPYVASIMKWRNQAMQMYSGLTGERPPALPALHETPTAGSRKF